MCEPTASIGIIFGPDVVPNLDSDRWTGMILDRVNLQTILQVGVIERQLLDLGFGTLARDLKPLRSSRRKKEREAGRRAQSANLRERFSFDNHFRDWIEVVDWPGLAARVSYSSLRRINGWRFCRLDFGQLSARLGYGSRWFVGALGVVICLSHTPAFGGSPIIIWMERRFLFRANVPLQSCVARICHASPRRFFLASGARNLRLDRSSAHLLSGHTLSISFTSRFSRWWRSTRQRGGPVHSFKAWQLRPCNSPLLSGSVRCYIAIMNRAVPICANAWLRQ
jgi:hypothetical protein